MNSFVLLRALAEAGHGIARLPDYMASENPKRLVRLLDAFTPEPMPWHVVYPSARHLSPKVRAFIELLDAHLARRAKGSW